MESVKLWSVFEGSVSGGELLVYGCFSGVKQKKGENVTCLESRIDGNQVHFQLMIFPLPDVLTQYVKGLSPVWYYFLYWFFVLISFLINFLLLLENEINITDLQGKIWFGNHPNFIECSSFHLSLLFVLSFSSSPAFHWQSECILFRMRQINYTEIDGTYNPIFFSSFCHTHCCAMSYHFAMGYVTVTSLTMLTS